MSKIDLYHKAAISLKAYYLWEAADKPENNADYFWFKAEKEFYNELLDNIDKKGYYVYEGPHIVDQPVVIDEASFNPHQGIVTKYGRKLLEEGKKYYGIFKIGQ